MKKRLLALTLVLSLLVSLFVVAAPATLAAAPAVPQFSQEGGLYNGSFPLTITASGAQEIRYTINGSEPTATSTLYTGPITVAPRSDYPMKDYMGHGKSLMSQMVVKAKAFNTDGASKTITNTYIVDPNAKTMFGMPVMSISLEPSDLMGSNGFYSNYNNETLEPQCFMEFYENDGSLGFKHSASVKISGHASRGANKKSLRFNFTKGAYENDGALLQYDILPSATRNYNDATKVTSHAKLNLRISDWEQSNLRESLTQNIFDITRLDTAMTRPAAVFLNGEFWGVYDIREQYDNNFIAQHYPGIKKGEVVMLSFDHDTRYPGYSDSEPLRRVEYSEGPSGQEQVYFSNYMDMYNLMVSNNITDPAVYAQLNTLADMDNYIDYLMGYMFTANGDWPGNNVKMWRSTTSDPKVYGKDGRWRWEMHDFDIAYHQYHVGFQRNIVDYFTTAMGDGDARRPEWSVKVVRNLLRNETFRNTLAARLGAYSGSALSTGNTQEILATLKSLSAPAKGLDLYRWNILGGSKTNLSAWDSEVNALHTFLENRDTFVLDNFREYYNRNFGTSIDTAMTKVTFNTDITKGWLDVSGAEIKPGRYSDTVASSFTGTFLRTVPIVVKANLTNENYKVTGYSVKVGSAEPQIVTGETLTFAPATGKSDAVVITPIYETLQTATVTTDKESYEANEEITLTVRAPRAATSIKLYNENGSMVSYSSIKWTTDAEGRTFTIKTSVATTGVRQLSIFTVFNGEAVDSRAKASFTITPPAPVLTSVSAPETAVKNESFDVTVVTSKTITKIRLSNETNATIGQQSSSYVDNGSVRTWTISTKIGTSGEGRKITVQGAAKDGIYLENTLDFTLNITK